MRLEDQLVLNPHLSIRKFDLIMRVEKGQEVLLTQLQISPLF